MRTCATAIDQVVTNHWTGEDERFEVCGHSEGEHGKHGCGYIVGDECDIGGEHGPIYCACPGFSA